MQGKESKHSEIKALLKNSTNRSTSQDDKGKWHQLARSNFVKTFYLPYHFPTDVYVSHSKSRNPPVDGESNACGCFRIVENNICEECLSLLEIIDNAISGEIPISVNQVLKHIQCKKCNEWLADVVMCREHIEKKHEPIKTSSTVNPKSLNVRCRDLPTTGNKNALCQRLEGFL